ncbi:unnamed protein product, partial [Rotaria sordida]
TAHFQLVLSRDHPFGIDSIPIGICYAGTGDHGFSRRRLFTAVPLINQYPIGSILLENPYYGLRKPPDQSRSSLLYVIDLYIMGEVLALETLMLLHWCQKMKLTSATLHGFSLGGHMASLAFTKWSDPLSRQFYENKIVLDLIKDMMRLVMDELTSSYNYSCSVQSNISNAMFIACTHDGYVLRDGIGSVHLRTGDILAFIFNWANTFILEPLSVAILSLTFATYFLSGIMDSCGPPIELVKMLAVFVVGVLGTVNGISVTAANRLNIAFVVCKTVTILVITIGGLVRIGQGYTQTLKSGFDGNWN